VPLGYLVFHAVCISSSLGALIVIGAMYRVSHARGLVPLTLAFATQISSYTLGVALVWGGIQVPMITGGTAEKALLSVKFFLQCSVTIWFALAARGLLSVPLSRRAKAVLWTFVLSSALGLALFVLLPDDLEETMLGILGVYAIVTYAFSMAYSISLPLRRSDRIPARYRAPVRAAAVLFLVLVGSMILQDVVIVLGAPIPPGIIDGACFFALSVAILVFCLDVLLTRAKASGILPAWREFGAAHGLTDRELDILAGLTKGLTYKEIGRRLFISLDTVKTHAGRVYKKSGVVSRAQLRYLCRQDDPQDS
jgi:DNA-binding CsgD family transcriptional regulator